MLALTYLTSGNQEVIESQHNVTDFLFLSGVFFITKTDGNVDVWDLLDRFGNLLKTCKAKAFRA